MLLPKSTKGSDIRSFSCGNCPKCNSEVLIEVSTAIREAVLQGRREMKKYLDLQLSVASDFKTHSIIRFINGVTDDEVDEMVEVLREERVKLVKVIEVPEK